MSWEQDNYPNDCGLPLEANPAQHLSLTIDDLEDRIRMLQDLRAKLSYLKRDLAALLASLPDPDRK